MTYLYGDATSFPLDENFIDTLAAATDACVSLFEEETAEQERRDVLHDTQKEADQALTSLDVLEEAVEKTLEPGALGEKATDASEEAAARIASAARTTLHEARADVVRRADDIIESLKTDLPQRIRESVAQFLIQYQLPNTRWTFHWRVEPGMPEAEAQIGASTPSQVQLKFGASIPSTSPWASALKVSDYDPQLAIVVQREEGMFKRKPRMRKEALYRHFVTEIAYAPGRLTMILRPTVKKPVPGLEVLVDTERPVVAIRPVDAESEPNGETMEMIGESAEALTELSSRIEEISQELIRRRHTLLSVRMEEDPTAELDEPGLLAERILQSIAPIVREMRKRSKVPGELALKRVLGDGRREELFVPRQEIYRKFAHLPDHQRRAFEAMGLGVEGTSDFGEGPTREYVPPTSGSIEIKIDD